jgi:hypothetical protein
LIFFPTAYPAGDWQPPGIEFEDLYFTAADGTHLHAWYLPHENPRAVLLFAHGNAGNLSDRGPVVAFLRERLRLSVMIFDYRGYGRSEGSPNEEGILMDARAARAALAQKAGVSETEIVLMGRSIGAAVMVDLAARDGARALILESTFTSLPDVASWHYAWLPVKRFMRTRLDSLSKIKDYHGPLLQSHGDADTIVPYTLGRQLFEAANEPKRFITISGRDHNDPQTEEYYQALDKFLDEV